METKKLKQIKKDLLELRKEQINGWHKVDIDSVVKMIDNLIWKEENIK